MHKYKNKLITKELIKIRKNILTSCFEAQAGHIASSFSIVEILFVLFKKYLQSSKNDFILSKGHGAPALYAVLNRFKIINRKQYLSYCAFGSNFTSHPSSKTPGVQVSSGALGMGLSIGIGMALANKLDNKTQKVYVLMGDGEVNEGSIWEALSYGGQYKQLNIMGIIDKNNLQASNFTEKIVKTKPLIKAIKCLGWEVKTINGHRLDEIEKALKSFSVKSKPCILVLNTIKGKGVSFMENNPEWHHQPINEKDYKLAIKELNNYVK